MAKQDERQRSTDPGDEDRIRGVGDTGEPPDDAADEDDFDDAEDLNDEDEEEAGF